MYSGTDPLTGRRLRHRETAKTRHQAQILLGKLLEQADAGRQPDSRVLVRELLTQYLGVAELEPSTRDSYEGYIRRTILPALGSTEVRKVRGPMLDTLYARLRRCGDSRCVSGKPVVEHNLFPDLSQADGGRFQRWQRIASVLRESIRSGELAPGTELPSVRGLAARYGLPIAAVRHAMESLAAEGLVQPRPGRSAIVGGDQGQAGTTERQAARRPRKTSSGHDCARSGCRPHTCKPLSPATVRQIHAILSGAFAIDPQYGQVVRPSGGNGSTGILPPRPSSPSPGPAHRPRRGRPQSQR